MFTFGKTLFAGLIVAVIMPALVTGQERSVKLKGLERPLHWLNPPADYKLTDTGIVITAPGKTDKYIAAGGEYSIDNAPLLVLDDNDQNFILSTKVSHAFASKWDSGGLVVEADATHWFKFEFEGDYTGAHRIVSVVTNEFSDDANSMEFGSDSIYVKVARAGDVFFLYVAQDGKNWYLVRGFKFKSTGPLKVGLIAQCPTGASSTITFSDVRYSPTKIKDMWKGE